MYIIATNMTVQYVLECRGDGLPVAAECFAMTSMTMAAMPNGRAVSKATNAPL